MPRSSYIYLVCRGDLLSLGAVPVAAFTVKHEMKHWLESHADSRADLKVYRMPDGGGGAAVEMSIDDILNA